MREKNMFLLMKTFFKCSCFFNEKGFSMGFVHGEMIYTYQKNIIAPWYRLSLRVLPPLEWGMFRRAIQPHCSIDMLPSLFPALRLRSFTHFRTLGFSCNSLLDIISFQYQLVDEQFKISKPCFRSI